MLRRIRVIQSVNCDEKTCGSCEYCVYLKFNVDGSMRMGFEFVPYCQLFKCELKRHDKDVLRDLYCIVGEAQELAHKVKQ